VRLQPKRNPLSRLALAARRRLPAGDGLHICKACRRPFACPVDWEADGKDHWLITLHCGECDTWCDLRATNEQTTAFDLELDRQTAQITYALGEFERERMQTLLAAFEHDLIEPADFAC
jgi:hypothetical protein